MRSRLSKFTAGGTMIAAVILATILGGAAPMAWAEKGARASDAQEGGAGSTQGALASFEGHQIDLANSWEGAGACIVWQPTDIQCFASEQELERHVAGVDITLSTESNSFDSSTARVVAVASSSCGSYLRLYDYTSFGGSSLWLATRYTWLNMANYGFNQRTSSFRVGGCSAYFADYASGGGAWYPTYLTQAWDSSPSMISGWNNDVSSVYIT